MTGRSLYIGVAVYCLLAWFGVAPGALATSQIPDTLRHGGWTHEVHGGLLPDDATASLMESARWVSSRCWLGYVAEWEIRDDRLWLTGLTTYDGEPIVLSSLSSNWSNRVQATWFSGKMWSQRVCVLFLPSRPSGGIHVAEREFSFKDGKLIGTSLRFSLLGVYLLLMEIAIGAAIVALFVRSRKLRRRMEEPGNDRMNQAQKRPVCGVLSMVLAVLVIGVVAIVAYCLWRRGGALIANLATAYIVFAIPPAIFLSLLSLIRGESPRVLAKVELWIYSGAMIVLWFLGN